MARDEGIKTLAEKMIELIGKMDQELGLKKNKRQQHLQCNKR